MHAEVYLALRRNNFAREREFEELQQNINYYLEKIKRKKKKSPK